jgi:DNA-directed RNA polymerase subunit E'/Rpb7
MDDIYFKLVLHKKIIINSKNLDENIDTYINDYLKSKVEGKCIDEGYIKPGSIQVIKKSIGMLLGSRFNGDITYDILYTSDITNPIIGNVIDCKVKFINKLGILGNNGPITIIVSKQFHNNNNDTINKIKEGDIIKVEVIDKKFSLNDTKIKIIGRLWDETKKEIIISDLSPINDNLETNIENDNYYQKQENEDNEESDEEYDDNDELDDEEMDDEEEEDDEENDEEDKNTKVIKIENPDENINVDEIELDDEDDSDLEESDIEDDYDGDD